MRILELIEIDRDLKTMMHYILFIMTYARTRYFLTLVAAGLIRKLPVHLIGKQCVAPAHWVSGNGVVDRRDTETGAVSFGLGLCNLSRKIIGFIIIKHKNLDTSCNFFTLNIVHIIIQYKISFRMDFVLWSMKDRLLVIETIDLNYQRNGINWYDVIILD